MGRLPSLKNAWGKIPHLIAITLFLFPSASWADKGKRALIVIDMQEYFATRNGHDKDVANQKKLDTLLDAQVEAIQEAKRRTLPIIFVEYEGFGTTTEKLKQAADGAGDVIYVKKDSDGAFDKKNSHLKELRDYLDEKKIETLVVTGANGGACVQRTILGALGENLSVVAFDTAIADLNYSDYLYPYDKYFAQSIVQFKCEDCSFRETGGLKEAFTDPVETKVKEMTEALLRAAAEKAGDLKRAVEGVLSPRKGKCLK